MMKVERAWIIICLMVLFACQRGGRGVVPDDLIGVWVTTEPTYEGCFFEIKANEIIFGAAENKFDAYPITKIRIEKDLNEEKTLYLICYKNVERQEYKFFFYYDPANQGTIRFKNQKEMLWTKRPVSSASN